MARLKHFVVVLATTVGLIFAHECIAGYALAAAIELRDVLPLGKFQTVLGGIMAGAALGLLVSFAFFALRIRAKLAVVYVLLGVLGVSAFGYAVVPTWPSHNAIRALGEIALVVTTVSVASVGLWGLAFLRAKALGSSNATSA